MKIGRRRKEKKESKPNYKTLNIDGTRYKTFLTKKFENRKKYTSPDDKKMISVLPGSVIKVFVKKGQKIKMGDNVMILEAMKIQNRIKSSGTGVIKSIKVKEGEKITKGIIILELE